MSQEKEQEKLSPEQIEANRIRVLNYYRTQAEVLTAQCEYEKLMAEIETHRAKRMEMIIRQAQMTAGPQEEETEPDEQPQEAPPAEEKKERKLKTK